MSFIQQDRKCRHCGGLDEFLYEINWKPVYYCASCHAQSGSGLELIGPNERLQEEAGE